MLSVTLLIMSHKHPTSLKSRLPDVTRETHPSVNSMTGSLNSEPRRQQTRIGSYILPSSFSRNTGRPTRVRSVPTAKTVATKDTKGPTVRDGKQFHVRVTLGYLKAITKTEQKKSGVKPFKPVESQTLVTTAFASLDPTSSVASDYVFAPSLPLDMTSDVTNAFWPRPRKHMDGNSTMKCNRRLYFSTMLQKDVAGQTAELNKALDSDDGNDDFSTGTWNPQGELYSPELVKIQLGLARGNDLLHLGVATLVVNGDSVSRKQMDLPVRALLPGEDCEGSTTAQKNRRLRGFFGKKNESAKNAFKNDGYRYSFTPNAILRIRLDISNEVTAFSGPALWGDLNDDNDSFGSITKKVVTEETIDMATSYDEYGSIEVVNNTNGTTIISAPVFKHIEPELSELSAFPISSIIAPKDAMRPQNPTGEYKQPSLLQSAMMCGALEAVDGHIGASQSLDFEDSSTIASSRYEGTGGERFKSVANSKSEMLPLKTITEDEATNFDIFPSTTSYSHYTDHNSIGDDTVESLTAAKQVLQKYASRAGVNIEDLLEDLEGGSEVSSGIASPGESIGDNTLDSVFQAKQLLLNYANRVGVDVEDILNADVVADSSSVEGSTSHSSVFGSISDSSSNEYTQNTKSTKSRFSLFL